MNEEDIAIKRFSNIFSTISGKQAIVRRLEHYFQDDYKGLTKEDQIFYLFRKYKLDTKKLMDIIQEILLIHNESYVRDNLNKINDALKFFNLFVESENMQILTKNSLTISLDDAKEQINVELNEIKKKYPNFPHDIMDNAEKMSHAYLLVYILENFLRLFIEDKQKKSVINFSKNLKRKIKGRKDQETKNQYQSIRASSDLFYLDIGDLVTIIENNWLVFKQFFPNGDFLKIRMNELRITRNHIAHNSVISNNDLRRLLTYFEDIIKQLS